MGEFFGAILAVILESILAALGYLLRYLLLYIVFFPLAYVLFTPFILIAAVFGPGDYGEKVATYYRGVPAAVGHTFQSGPW